MLELRYVRENKEAVIQRLQKRNLLDAASLIDQLLLLDQHRKTTQTTLDATTAQLNMAAKAIGRLMKEGKKEQAQTAKTTTSTLKETQKNLSGQLLVHETSLQAALDQLPNLPHAQVPSGRNAEDNEVVCQAGEMPILGAGALPHWELAKKYDIIDFELGNKITGAGFPVYKRKGARLQRALINFFLDEALKQGYEEMQLPIVINKASAYATGQLPDKEGNMYQLVDEHFYLSPTAEVPLTNCYRESILCQKELPIKNVGYTPCFRREAGSWGSHVRGLNRLHQFDKVELIQILPPEHSYDALQEMCAYVQGLLEKLRLPFRKLKLCGGDLGFTAAFTYDLEVFSAAQEQWLEVSSISNFETYQTTRLKLRYRNEANKIQLLHTINGSALPLPRIMAALLENNQSPTNIRIPEVLTAYTGFMVID